MSIIMALGNKHRLILASDGRVSETDNNGDFHVLDEKFKKIIRLSSSVYVLIAGNRSQCMQIIHILQNDPMAIATPQLCVDAIIKIIKNHVIFIKKNLNVKMIIAGFSFLKERELYVFSADKNGVEKEKIPLNDNVTYIAKGDIEEGEVNYFEPILNTNGRDIRMNIKLCISEAAKRNKSVNDTVFFEEL